MADLGLPLSAGEDTFELHSVQLKLEAVERRIHELLGKQAQLSKRKATLETSRADAHKSGVSMQRTANTPTTSTPYVFSAQAPCTWDVIGSLGYTIMGKTADLTVVQKTIIDTLHKEGKPQTFIAKEAVHRVLYPSMLTES